MADVAYVNLGVPRCNVSIGPFPQNACVDHRFPCFVLNEQGGIQIRFPAGQARDRNNQPLEQF